MDTDKLYQEELKQSDVEHHTPTAVAMVGHIISNLLIHSLKISQAKFFAKGNASLFLQENGDEWIKYEQLQFNHLNQILVNNGLIIPTTIDQFGEYTMLEQNGADKYLPGQEQLFNLVKDFDTQILFITKAIALAKKEELPDLESDLVELLSWTKEQIATAQSFLGHELHEGSYTEEDDDEF